MIEALKALQGYFKGWRDGIAKLKDEMHKGPGNEKPLIDVTVFKGPSGVWTVSEDRTLWMVDKVVAEAGIAYNDGESHYKSIHPRCHIDNEECSGTYRSKESAISRAREWSGMDDLPAHPVPNRRAAIAHARAQS